MGSVLLEDIKKGRKRVKWYLHKTKKRRGLAVELAFGLMTIIMLGILYMALSPIEAWTTNYMLQHGDVIDANVPYIYHNAFVNFLLIIIIAVFLYIIMAAIRRQSGYEDLG